MDAYRHGDSFVIHLDLPGVDPASIDLTVERNSGDGARSRVLSRRA